MLYYYYGFQPDCREPLRANEMQEEDFQVQQYGELVIEEDTIYEIDEACLNCKKRNRGE